MKPNDEKTKEDWLKKRQFYKDMFKACDELFCSSKSLNTALLNYWLKRTPHNRENLIKAIEKTSLKFKDLNVLSVQLPETDNDGFETCLDTYKPGNAIKDIQDNYEQKAT